MEATHTVDRLLAKSLRSRALIANALCAIAEEQAHSGNTMRAVETVKAVRGVLGEISLILTGDATTLPAGTLQDVADLLDGLGNRITTAEAALAHSVQAQA